MYSIFMCYKFLLQKLDSKFCISVKSYLIESDKVFNYIQIVCSVKCSLSVIILPRFNHFLFKAQYYILKYFILCKPCFVNIFFFSIETIYYFVSLLRFLDVELTSTQIATDKTYMFVQLV